MRGLAGLVTLDGGREEPELLSRLRSGHSVRPNLAVLEGHDGRAPQIAADIRLDEPQELGSALGLPAGSTNEALALAAYERWGDGFVDRLVGDFALAIVDRRNSRLLLVRDHLGTRPLAFACTTRYVAFGSDPSALAQLDGVDGRDDEQAMLAVILDSTVPERTPFRGVRRVRGGHLVEVDLVAGTARSRRWWSPDLAPLHLGSDAEYAECFRGALERAVLNRLPVTGPVGADLSGGLDSSSVAAMAAEVRGGSEVVAVGTDFSDLRWNGGFMDEGVFRRAVAEKTGVTLTELPAGDAIRPGAADSMIRAQAGPYAGLLLLMAAARYRMVAESGATVVLDGYDGDTSVNLGFQRLIRLIATGRWVTLHRELTGLAGHSGASYRAAVYEGVWLGAVDWLRWVAGEYPVPRGVARRDLLEHSGLGAALRAERPPFPWSPSHEALFQLQGGWLGSGFEAWDRVGLAAGIEVRHPFADRRLVELCLRLPPEQHMQGGWTRWVLRQALTDLLPPEMTWRTRKGSLPSDFVVAYATSFPVESVLRASGGAASPYLDSRRFAEVRQRWRERPSAADAFTVLSVAAVDRWITLMA